jgi:hypothetical protein
VASANIKLQKITGDNQLLTVGQNAQPFLLRVIDSSSPAIAVPNIPVTITGSVYSPAAIPDCNPPDGVCRPAANIFVAGFGVTLISDTNGIVSFTPALQAAWGAVRVAAIASAGTSAAQNLGLQVIAPQP